MVFVRSAYNYNTNLASEESALYCEDGSRTKQSFKEECDINTILKRFNVTGQLPVQPLQPQYGDFSGVTDYQTALNAVIAAQEAFEALPAVLRNRFANDPAAFVDYCSDETNRAEMIELGLIVKEATKVAVEESPPAPEEGA